MISDQSVRERVTHDHETLSAVSKVEPFAVDAGPFESLRVCGDG